MVTYQEALDNETLNASEIINREDVSLLICDLYDTICMKCENGTLINELNGIERVFYLVKTFDVEMNNGSIYQFYKNEFGNYANETVEALMEVGADILALILDKGNSIFRNGIVPENLEERLRQIDEVDESDKMWLFDNLDYEFKEYSGGLDALCLTYVRDHKEAFM